MRLSVILMVVTVCASGGPALAGAEPCRSTDLTAAEAARHDAEGSLKAIVNYLDGGDTRTADLLKRWFGTDDLSARQAVRGTLKRSADWISSIIFYCLYANDGTLIEEFQTPTGSIIVDGSGDTYAYVNPGDMSRVYLGLRFFEAPTSGYDSKLGTVIHEMTHFWLTGSTDDIEYAKDDCLDLANNDFDGAQKNADNYQYFVEKWLQ
jgi:hypothetical protein